MKKVASLVGAGAMLLALSVPVLAGTEVEDNWASIKAKVKSVAVSGDNSIHGKYVWGAKIKTGDAVANALVSNMVNSVEVGCGDCSHAEVDGNGAKIRSRVKSVAISGDNSIHGKVVGGGKIVTGFAGAESLVSNVVNSVVTPTEVTD